MYETVLRVVTILQNKDTSSNKYYKIKIYYVVMQNDYIIYIEPMKILFYTSLCIGLEPRM